MATRIVRVEPLSLGKILGILYAALGLVAGAFLSLFALVSGLAGAGQGLGAMEGVFFGVGAVVVLPVLYGVIGFVGGLVTALLYNLVARAVGPLEVELEAARPAPGAAPPV